MTALLTTLTEGPDNFEIIRDQIAAILLSESVGQQALATAGGKDPTQWAIRVFTESSRPFEEYRDAPSESDERATPIVNVSWDNSTYDQGQSNTVERQKATSTYNIDCFGYGISKDTPGGHQVGDQHAAIQAHRVYRLARRFLMAGPYTYLRLRGVVWRRWPGSATAFQPQIDNRALPPIIAVRLALNVEHNELSPQFEGTELDAIYLTVCRQETGEILFESAEDPLLIDS